MKLVAVALFAILLTGCAGIPRMNNDMIILEAAKCDQAGLPWRQVFNYDGSVSAVYCTNAPVGRQNLAHY